MTATAPPLPRWDMTVVYPGLESPEFAEGFAAAVASVAELAALFDRRAVAPRPPAALDAATVAAFEEVIARYNDALERMQTLSTYITSFIATDSRDALAQARMSELQSSAALLDQLGTRFAGWVGSLDLAALCEQSALARAHRYPLERAQQSARRQMPLAEELLASELSLSGAAAWRRLYNTLTSQLSADFVDEGRPAQVPISVLRNYAYHADRALRRRAHATELGVWRDAAIPLAAALNGIKGEVNLLTRRRSWGSALDESLFVNNIDRATLDAMLAAAREAFPHLRRFFHAKARALGIEQLAWYDLFAPLGASQTAWDYWSAEEFIVRQFASYSERLSAFAARAFRERWVDAPPQPGKRGGAFCMYTRPGESRILANYTPSFIWVIILAHELGHAYHNFNLIDRTPLQSRLPETLGETASIFCETIVRQAALQRADAQEQLAILNQTLQSSAQRVFSVTSNFLFEQRLFERRQQRELSIDELCTLTEQSQRETYGDGLDAGALHPYLWAAKVHYYDPALSFYNYPYMFGLLFGLGLYAQYQRDPGPFTARYDALLASSGLADAATLAAQFGIDIRAPEFWRASLDVIRADVDRFEQLCAAG